MPKIIQNLERKLIEEARSQIETQGYGAVTIRSVAKACGVGVGTVYNYFPSKDALVAAYMMADWKQCRQAIGEAAERAADAETVVRCIYRTLREFADRHAAVLQDPDAAAAFSAISHRYHGLLRKELSRPLERFCESELAARVVAESLLTWTMIGIPFDDLYRILGKLFNTKGV